ncbi:hypothetical protein BZG02_11115 [Labilibaculum filiforme]|uniref:PKD domain-containing protein n=1 Tax=Labilibaculum filiforme TaxID=1940526 RepID=A0A2N3HXI2_9BACT|nr:Ig-like domain-containing protein [Labilibaculum filiforme]PKQ62751.1 hypothetical protein BZG02_11115 [Labilibaculum filiforme]
MRNFLLKNLKLLKRKVSAFSLIFFLLIPLGGFSQTADFSIALSSQCGNGTATFTDTSGPEPVTQWSWDFGNSNSLVTTDPALGQNPSAIFPTPGAYTVSLSVNGGLAVSKEIIIHPNPEPDFSPSTTAGCEPLDIVLSATANNVDVESYTIDGKIVGGVNGGNIVDYQWDFQGKLPGIDDTEPVLSLSGIGANDYGALLIVTDEFGCKGTKFQPSVFQVHPIPTADFNFTKDNSCGLGDVTFDGLATIASGQISEYQWDVDNDGSIEAISESYTHSFATAGIFDVALSLKSDQGCLSNKVIKQVQFNDGNTTDFSFSGNCAGQMVTFTDESSATAIAWSWDFNGDNIEDSNAQNPTTTFSSAGDKTVTLTATHNDACVMVLSKIVAISSASAAFTYDLSAACAPSYKVLFTNTSSASTGTITSYSWDFDGDNVEDSNLANPNFEFNASGTHPVKLTVVSSEACESTFTKEVIINEKSVDFSIISPAMGCEGLSVDFEAVYSDAANDAVLSWNWTFEGLEESSISNPSHTFASRGEYDVKLRIETSNGCILTESKPDAVQVGKKPIITNVTDPPSDCANDAVSFTATFTGLADSLFWDFSNGGNKTSAFTDGNSPQTISHTFTEDSDSHSLIVTAFDNGCASDAITVSNIEIKQPVARFTASKTVVCAVPETLTFTNLSSSDAVGTSYEWDFNGDNIVDSTDENPSFTYTVAGDYTVTLTVYNPDTGCTDERSQKIFVTTSSPNFVTDKTLACHPANISFTNQIIANSSANFSIDKVEWDFDNNGSIDSDEENPDYTYASPDSYGIRMTVTEENGCVYPVLKDGLVSINGPVASFTKLPLEACLNDEIAFTNTTTKFSADPANPDNYSYSWNFGDGASSNLKNPTHTYVSKDVFEVSLLVSDDLGCSNTFTESNSVIVPNLVAGFTTSKEIYCLGATVEFTNTANTTNGTASITNYEWDLDGNGSYEISTVSDANQSLLFSVAGTFTVKQKITSSLGCTDEFSKEITIVDGDGSFTPDAINLGCAPASTTFRANDGVDVVESYAWDFGDGGISEKRDPMHFYVNPGSYNVTLTVVLTGGCTKTSTQTVFVAGPVGDFSYNNITGCANPNHEVTFTASNMQDVTSLVWDFGNGITRSETLSTGVDEKSTIYNYMEKGTKLPILILTDDGTCGAYSYIREDLGRINTSTPPTVDFSKSSGDNICENVEFQFSDLSVLTDDRYQIVSWSWDFDEDGVEDSNAKNPSFTYTAAGTYDVSLTVTTNFGCTASLTKPAFITVVSPDNLTDLAITITEPGTVNSKFCSFDNVTFNGSATTSNGDNSISGWVWDFGDGNDASVQNAPHSYSAVDEGLTRTVTLTVTDNSQCVQSITKEVSIYKVDADFSITSSPVLRGNNIAFADLSTSKINVASDGIIDDWAWTFEEGTPTSSAAQNPSIIYNTIGSNYNVGLTVTNYEGCTDNASKTVSVLNNPPIVSDFGVSGNEDTDIAITQIDFDSNFDTSLDPSQTIVKVKIISLPANGDLYIGTTKISTIGTELTYAQLANLKFVPDENWNGNTSFIYNASDGYAYANVNESITITVNQIQDVPVVSDIVLSTNKDVNTTFDVATFEDKFSDVDLVGNTNPDFQKIKITEIPDPLTGVLKLNDLPVLLNQEIEKENLANLVFEPFLGFVGTSSFSWNGSDDADYASNVALINIEYFNTKPQLTSVDLGDQKEDELVTFPMSFFLDYHSDIDVNDDPFTSLKITSLPSSAAGVFKLNGTAPANLVVGMEIPYEALLELEFTPAAGFNGTIELGWDTFDGTEYSEAPATISFTYVNTPPTVSDFAKMAVDEDTQVDFTASNFTDNFTDVDVHDVLTRIKIKSLPANGTLKLNGVVVTDEQNISLADLDDLKYFPNPDFNGTDSFTWKGNDGTINSSNTASVNLTIKPVQDKPTVGNISKLAIEDDPVSITAQDFIDEFSDVDALYGNPNSTLVEIIITSLPANGTLELNGVAVAENDVILLADIDTGSGLVFVPNLGYEGDSSFDWNASDGLEYATTDATVTIKHTNTPPVVASHDFGTKLEDVVFTLTRNDFMTYYSDEDATDAQFKHVKIISLPSSTIGSFTIDISGTDEVLTTGIYSYSNLLAGLKFTPNSGANGIVELVWNAEDGTEYGADDATFSFTYINSIPTVADFAKTAVDEDNNVIFATTDFSTEPTVFTDVDVHDDLDKIQIKSLPTNGSLELDGVAVTNDQIIDVADLGKLVYIPNPDFNGTDSFTWIGNDGTDYSTSIATVSLTVNAVNDPPAAQNDSFNTDEDVQLSGDLKADNGNGLDADIDSNPADFIYTVFNGGTAAANGTILLNADGTFTYDPNPDFVGTVSFTYQVCDDASAPLVQECVTATVSITVDPVQDKPTLGNISKYAPEDNPVTISAQDFIDEFSDVDALYGNPNSTLVEIKITSLPANGTLELNGVAVILNQVILLADIDTGSGLVFVPNDGYEGDSSFDWNASDGLEYATTDATVTIKHTNTPPVVTSHDFGTKLEDVVFTLTRNNFETYYSDADATDSQFKHVKIVSLPSSDLGVFTIDISGTDEVLTPGIYSYSNLLAGLKFTPKSGANGTVNLVWNGEDGTEYGADDATFSFTYINSIPTVADFAKTAVDEDSNVIFATTDFSTEPTVFSDVDVHDDLDKIQIKSLPNNGSLELDGVAVTNDQIIDAADLGKLVYIPNPDFNGTDSFTWKGNDGTDYSSSTATVSLFVNAVNDPPVAQNDSFNTDEDAQLSGDLKADNGNGLDADIDSNPADFIYTVFNGGTAAANGTILLNADGTFTYDPNPDFVGTVSFTYQVCDDASAPLVQECVTATVSITVDPVQDKPTLGNISKYAPEDNSVTISAQDFKDQFSDVDALYGNANSTLVKIKITSLPDPIIGFLYLNGVPVTLNQEILVDDIDAGLGLVFIPNPGHEEEASFNWNASDGIDYALTDATVNIKHTNTPPVVVSHDFGTKLEDVVFTLTRNDFETYYSDADATDTQFQHVKIISLPLSELGVFTIDISGTDEVLTLGIYSYSNLLAGLKFTPKPGANGTVNLEWNGEDGTEYGADNATFSFTYINSIPTVADFSKPAVDEDSNVIFTATDFSTEPTVFSDVDIYDDLDEIQIKSLPFNGTLELDGVAVTDEQIISVADLGKLVYIPNPNFDGTDSFTWKGNDGTDYSSSTSTVSLFVNAVNDPPVAQDDSFNTDEDVQLSGNLKANNGNGLDTDVDSDPDDFIYTITDGGTASTNGTILVNADGTFTYEPNPDFFGVVSFTYQVCDDASTPLVQECVTATVTITVDPINDTPLAVDDDLWLKEDASISGNVFDNDEKLVDTPVVIVSNTDPANGTLVLNADGTFTYTPNSGYFGDDSFTYTLRDADGEESTATVSVVVDPLDYEPIANDDFDTINEDETSSGDLLSNDEDLINPPVVVISNTNPANGTVVVNADGTYIYTPNPDFNGIDTFTYTIEDADGDQDTATVSITVNPVNDTPIAVNDTNTVDEDTPVSANVLDNDTNLGDGPVTVVSNTDPANGTVVVNADGTYTYTPDEGFFGTDTFEYTLEDADGEQSTATITITVNSVNDVPLGVDDVNSTDENTVVTGNVLTNDSDVDGDLLTVVEINGETALVGTNIQLSGGGILRLNADGTYEFDPNGMYEYLNTDEEAYESFTYVLNDGTENGNEVSVVITIVGVNDAPIADDDQIDALDNEEVRIDVLDGDFDADGDDLIVSIVTDPIYGDVIVNEDGSISYIANLGAYCETDQITYQICDPEGLCDQATVTIEIGISDQDEDSIPDAIETLTADTDSDSTPDYLDLDSDNDGISDEDEAQISDSCTNLPIDTDADGIPDYRDTDSDNDGFTDKEEGDDDCDNDGIADYIDAYDDCAEYVFIPEGFSPNGDGINDFFVIKGIKDFPNSVLMIFNRWGAKIYSTKGYQNNWDGRADNSLTVGSEIIPEGTYYYVIDLGDGSKALKGFIYINY